MVARASILRSGEIESSRSSSSASAPLPMPFSSLRGLSPGMKSRERIGFLFRNRRVDGIILNGGLRQAKDLVVLDASRTLAYIGTCRQTPNRSDVPPALAKALQLHQQGKLAEAERLYAEILAAGTSAGARSPITLLNHGRVLNALGRRDEALHRFEEAIALQPKLAEAHMSRGAALAAIGRSDDALAGYRRALEIAPDYPEAHFAMGNDTLGRGGEALASFDRALALRPDHAQAHSNRGILLAVLGRNEEALASYDRALALNPRYAEALNNRSGVLRSLNRYDEALADLDRAVAIDPSYTGALYNRGRVLSKLNRAGEAAASHRRAVAAQPSHAEARVAACFAELPIIYEDEADVIRQRAAFERELRALAADVEAGRVPGNLPNAVAVNQPFNLAYQGYDGRELRSLYGALSSRIAAHAFPAAALPPAPAPHEPVRVGIVSGFFYQHSNWKIPIKGWLSQLDRRQFQIFGYHVGGVRDAETDVAAGLCRRSYIGSYRRRAGATRSRPMLRMF